MQKVCKKCGVNRVEVACCTPAADCHAEVTATLECGHEVSWVCGSDEDPRLKADECQACVYPVWERLIEEKNGADEERALINELFVKIENLVDCFEGGEVKKVGEEALRSSLVSHGECRAQVVRRFLDCERRNGRNITVPKYRSLCDQRLYELVFVEGNGQEEKECLFEQEATLYGRGYALGGLSRAALNRCKPDADGKIRVVVGVAFRFQASPFCPPFCAALGKKGKS